MGSASRVAGLNVALRDRIVLSIPFGSFLSLSPAERENKKEAADECIPRNAPQILREIAFAPVRFGGIN